MGLTASSWDSSSISTLFSSLDSTSLFGTTTNTIGQTISTSSSMLSDWYSIKNGSYSKLLKAYYAQESDTSTSSTDSDDDVTSTYETASKVKAASSSLKSASSALMDSSIYSDDNMSDLYNYVSDFASSYNTMITIGAKSDSSSITSNISSMKSFTSVNKNLLSAVGVSVSSSGKLSVDEDTFKNASASTVKSLFGSSGSYGYQINALASSTNVYASSSLSSGYTSSGTYSYTSASTYTSYV